MKKQLVRATLVLEVPVLDGSSVIKATELLNERIAQCRDIGEITGTIHLIKVSETGKQSRTKLGDVA